MATHNRTSATPGPSGHSSQGDRFAGLELQLRGRAGLTQRDIAARLGLHVHSVQLWEASASHPNARRLQALLEVFLDSGAFTSGLELEEAEALWTAAMYESPRLNTPFDAAWFARQLRTHSAPQPARVAQMEGHKSWGTAPDVERFLSRDEERTTLQRWIVEDSCRVIGVLGIGGIGKTQLATRVAHDLEDRFQHVYWRSLQNAPGFNEWLAGAIGLLSPGDAVLSATETQQVDRLLDLIRQAPTLLILDNVETVLQPGEDTGHYLSGYAAYGELLKVIADTTHRSCVLLTSREEPPEFGLLKGSSGPVRTLTLSGLGIEDVLELLRDKRLVGDATAWANLVDRYGGNGLALKVIGETIRELFGGNIAEFLEDVEGPGGGGVGAIQQLLKAQVGRLSHLEGRLLRWMAVEREPVTFGEIAAELGPALGRGPVREATAALLRRSLVERLEPGPMFVLQPVILEYVTEQLTHDVCHAIVVGASTQLCEQPLLKATARDFIRRSQERLILDPIAQQLTLQLGSRGPVERRLLELLSELRAIPPEMQAYGPGNLINLLCAVRGNLRSIDLSRLHVRQAYLQGLPAQDADLSGSHVLECALPEAFHNMSVALSSDGAHLVIGTSAGAVCLRRASDRRLLLSVPGHAGAVWRVALSRDGRLIVSASEDGTALVRDASTGQLLASLTGHTDFVQGVAISDDNLVATASQDGTVKLWDATHGEVLRTFESPDGGLLSVQLSRDAGLLIAGTRRGSIAFWDVASGRLLDALQAHTASIPGLALTDDGNLLASASLDGTARLWHVPQRSLQAEFVGHDGGLWDASLARDGKTLATSGEDGTVRLWSIETGQLQTTLVGHHGAVWDVSLSADGARVASAGQDGSIRLSDTHGGALLSSLPGHTSAFRDVALNPEGDILASGSQDGMVTVWDVATGQPRWTFNGHTAGVTGVALSGDAGVVASASQDGTVKVWEVSSGRLRCALSGHSGSVWDVALSGDGSLVASSSYDTSVRLWDTRRGEQLLVLLGHIQGVRGVALNDARRFVVSGSQDGSLMLWDTQSGQLRTTLTGHTSSIQSVAVDDSGHLIASAAFDGIVKLWDATTGRCVRTLPAHSRGVLCLQLSRDGRLLVTGGFDRLVKLWDTSTGEMLNSLTGHTGAVWGVSLNARASMLASGSFDGTIRLWDIPSGTCRRTLQPDRPLERVNITGLTGVTEAQRVGLMALGAVDSAFQAPPDQGVIETLV